MKTYLCSIVRKTIINRAFLTPFLTTFLSVSLLLTGTLPAVAAESSGTPSPVQLSSEEDHQRSLALLGIEQLRPGVDGNRPGEAGGVNYTENLANPYLVLPDPLVNSAGIEVTDAQSWWQQRRPETLQLFDSEIYGKTPVQLPGVTWEIESTSELTINGIAAVKKHLAGTVDNSAYPAIDIVINAILVLPADMEGPVPVMMQLIIEPFMSMYQERALEPGSWQSLLLEKGWGYVYLDTYTVQGDNGGALTEGIIGLVNQGQPRKLNDWGVLKAWGWGASKLLDYFETDSTVDASRIGIEGHSRWGKAALVTMAYDPRFAIAYISSSGSGGAKLHRRNYGEIVENTAGDDAYHWMGINYMKYAGPLQWNDLPVDAHQLIALAAPRPVFIGAGNEGDFWVDPKGMFLAAAHAGPVYELLGGTDMGTEQMPELEMGLMDGDIAFRQHREGHTDRPNWPYFIEFAARYFQR